MTVYNPTQRILIVRNKKGKIVKAFGGDIAAEKWNEKLTHWINKRKN